MQSTNTITRFDNGVDVNISMVNNTGSDQDIPDISLSSFRLSTIQSWKAQLPITGTPTSSVSFDPSNQHTIVQGNYPGDLYSPVLIFGDSNYTIGVSIQYPAIAYHQGMRIRLNEDYGGLPNSATGWDADFHGSDAYGNLHPSFQIHAGETRTYTVSIRIIRHDIATGSGDYLATITPYRDYFQTTYGGPKYIRDNRPVCEILFAEGGHRSTSPSTTNTRGFVYDGTGGRPNDRPDIAGGYGAAASYMPSAVSGISYNRVMIWALSGLYTKNSPDNLGSQNFPFQAFTGCSAFDTLANVATDLSAMRSGSLQVGYWWGHSTTIMTTWDADPTNSAQTYPYIADPNNPSYSSSDTTTMFNELDTGLSFGADVIGLDDFGFGNDPWSNYYWAQRLLARNETTQFVSEILSFDILHTVVPGFIDSGPNASLAGNSLADFLIPGEETWQQNTSTSVTGCRTVAGWGYVVLQANGVTNDGTFDAATGWTDNSIVPTALQTSPVGFHNALKCNAADVCSVGGEAVPDGQLTGDDYTVFMTAFSNGDAFIADICNTGQQPYCDHLVTGDDYVYFINCFFNGCP